MKPPLGIALDITRDWAASLPEPLTNDQFQRLNDLQTWIARDIAAAVAAERELAGESDRIVLALADIVNDLPVIDIGGGDSITGRIFAQRVSQHAAAIRARGEVKA